LIEFFKKTLIEAQTDVRTSDGYLLRVFCIAFTQKMRGQIRKTSYAQHTQVSLNKI
jgi:small subunit ribosomal protein S3Ae